MGKLEKASLGNIKMVSGKKSDSSYGYRHPSYAASYAGFGEPVYLANCNGWVLKRAIPGTSAFDAMGCYPLFSCQNWEQLVVDLEVIGESIVTFSAVLDPLGKTEMGKLARFFPDLFKVFKTHYLVELNAKDVNWISKHHQRNARQALKQLRIEKIENTLLGLDDWCRLYDVLKERHQIRGISAFSRRAFAVQLSVPGMVAFQATYHGEIAGMLLWYANDGISYYHLGAYSKFGYEQKASFALFRYAIDYFSCMGFDCLNLGAGSGIKATPLNGLDRFKSGWSNARIPAYIAGKIFDRAQYLRLQSKFKTENVAYFPVYRAGEFG